MAASPEDQEQLPYQSIAAMEGATGALEGSVATRVQMPYNSMQASTIQQEQWQSGQHISTGCQCCSSS